MKVLQMMLGFVLTLFAYLFGKMDIAFLTLLIVIILDIVTGLTKSYVTNTLNSKTGLQGCIKKTSYLSLVAVAVIIDRICNSEAIIRTFVIYYIVVNECISILENCVAMKLPVPRFLIQKLEALQKNDPS